MNECQVKGEAQARHNVLTGEWGLVQYCNRLRQLKLDSYTIVALCAQVLRLKEDEVKKG